MFTSVDQNDDGATRTQLDPLSRPLSPAGLLGRRALKRFLYAQMALRQGLMIALGKEQPLVPFTVEGEPPSVYWVFRLRAEAIEGLEGRLGLPPGFSLAPIRCLADDDERGLYLTLNVYRVSGLANGIRAEWSVYVTDGGDTPRYMVVGARSSQVSMDPVDIITPATPVAHARDDLVLRTAVGEGPDAFTCTLLLPPGEDPDLVATAPEWATANDYIYWGNGICDRTYYDAGMAAARQIRLPASAATIVDGTPWATIVEPDPAHILVLLDPIELVVSPWENVDRLRR